MTFVEHKLCGLNVACGMDTLILCIYLCFLCCHGTHSSFVGTQERAIGNNTPSVVEGDYNNQGTCMAISLKILLGIGVMSLGKVTCN